MSGMVVFAWISVMLLIGMFFRAKVSFLGNILMPASVIGGIIGFFMMNIPGVPEALGIDPAVFTTLVNVFFTLSFISMGLTSTPKATGQSSAEVAKEMTKGSIALAAVWNLLYAVQPLIGFGVLLLIGSMFNMPAEYGLLFPFAFCQGPGQSASFGTILDTTSPFTSASQVAITYAVIGFMLAFLVGVPIAKLGLKKGLAAHPEKIRPAVMKGLYPPEEQTENCGKITTYNGNVDVLAFHLALVGVVFLLTLYVQSLLMKVPVTIVQTLAAMTFMVGYFLALVAKFVLVKTNLKQYHDDILQTRITGATTDFLIVGAFMAVQLTVVGKWLIPILIAAFAVGAVTLALALFFGPRIHGDCAFERTLGLWGCLTGTCPSGIALIRVVDPSLRTTSSAEMGMMNVFMFSYYFMAPLIIEFCCGNTTFMPVLILSLILIAVSMAILTTLKCVTKPSYSLRQPTVCPSATDDCDIFEVSATHSPF